MSLGFGFGFPRGRATAGLWTPAQITTAVWLDANDASTITLNGSTVSEWRDKSGNGRKVSQAVASAQPAYSATGWSSSMPAITFDGSADSLLFSSPITLTKNVTAISYFAIAQRTGGAGLGTIIATTTTNTGQARASLFGLLGTLEAGGRRLDTDGYQSTSISISGKCLASAEFNFNGATLNVGANGVYQARGGGFQTAGSTSNTDSGAGGIGVATPGELFGGPIVEVVATQSILSTSDRQKLEGYLAWKWGLQANLPVGHPYKNTPPTI